MDLTNLGNAIALHLGRSDRGLHTNVDLEGHRDVARTCPIGGSSPGPSGSRRGTSAALASSSTNSRLTSLVAEAARHVRNSR